MTSYDPHGSGGSHDEPTMPLASPAWTPDAEAAPAAGRQLRLIPLVLGLVYVGIAAAWGLIELDLLSADDLRLTLPLVLIGAGAAGLFASTAAVRRDQRRA